MITVIQMRNLMTNSSKNDILYLSSPLTGDGSRGRTYTVSIEEKHSSQPNLATNGHDSTNGTQITRTLRNILTGENCDTYSVCQEMRSEKLDGTMGLQGGLQKKCKTFF
ncbi:unnamed protein product [Trichobilharzia regenti]|nr:unnamed protein product [Trichobilharzia regenti]